MYDSMYDEKGTIIYIHVIDKHECNTNMYIAYVYIKN